MVREQDMKQTRKKHGAISVAASRSEALTHGTGSRGWWLCQACRRRGPRPF